MPRYFIAGVVPEDGGGYRAYFPDLPASYAVGDTVEKTLELAEATLHSEVNTLLQTQQDIPAPSKLFDAKSKLIDILEEELKSGKRRQNIHYADIHYLLIKFPSPE